MGSERMRELQEMEKQIQGDVELGEIQPEGREVNLGAGSFRATDSNEGKEEERKSLLKRLAAAKVTFSATATFKATTQQTVLRAVKQSIPSVLH
jgi:hypothetical protein